jgi:hypothetical protein
LVEELRYKPEGSRCVELLTLPSTCDDCLEIWEPQTAGCLILLHKPIPSYGNKRSTPSAPQDQRFNPNQTFDVYSWLFT